MYEGFSAPYRGLPDEAYNGLRRFPLSIPFDSYDNGNGAAQTHDYRALLAWRKPVHFIWGCADDVFTEAWGRTWAGRMNASFDPIDAGHFLQSTHGEAIADRIIQRDRGRDTVTSARANRLTDTDEISDGRLRRGQRSRAAMVQALFDLVGEGVLQPTAQQVADRAGVRIRTVFRHFADMESLLAEVNGRVREHTIPLFQKARSGGGLEGRVRGLVESRARLFEQIAPYKRSGNLQRWRSRVVEREQAIMVRKLRADLLAWLPELRSADSEIVEALDAALSFEIWDRLRGDQELGRERTRAVLERIVTGVLNAAQ